MVTRLITVPISTDTSLNVVRSGDILGQFHGKQFIQTALKQLLTRQVDITLHIVRHVPGVLHREALRYIAPTVYRAWALISNRSEGSSPSALTIFTAHVFGFRINQRLV